MHLLKSVAPSRLVIDKVIGGVGKLHVEFNFTCAQMLLGSGYNLALELDNASSVERFDYWLWYFIDTYLDDFSEAEATAINAKIAQVQDKRALDDLYEEVADLLLEGLKGVRLP